MVTVQMHPLKTLIPDFCENGLGLVRTYISRSLDNFDIILHTAASDCSGNIHIWRNLEQTDVIFTAHTKSITDLVFVQLSLNIEPMIASCSLDGSLKIWDVSISQFTPVYEHFSSKKWVFSIHFDPTLPALFLNQEGKNCP